MSTLCFWGILHSAVVGSCMVFARSVSETSFPSLEMPVGYAEVQLLG